MADVTETLTELIAQLERATGPSFELDEAIWCALNLNHDSTTYNGDPRWKSYTQSIDSALTLVPEGCDLEIYFDTRKNRLPDTWLPWLAQAGAPNGRFHIGKSEHGAIALCIAALKARAPLTTAQRQEGE